MSLETASIATIAKYLIGVGALAGAAVAIMKPIKMLIKFLQGPAAENKAEIQRLQAQTQETGTAVAVMTERVDTVIRHQVHAQEERTLLHNRLSHIRDAVDENRRESDGKLTDIQKLIFTLSNQLTAYQKEHERAA